MSQIILPGGNNREAHSSSAFDRKSLGTIPKGKLNARRELRNPEESSDYRYLLSPETRERLGGGE